MLKSKRKVAFITGASRGIGKAIAIDLANRNTDIVIGYKSSEKKAEAISKKISKENVKSMPVHIDLEDTKSIFSAVDKVNRKFGSIDILVNNAAIHIENDFLRISEIVV